MNKLHPTIGCCGIDCGLCPRYYTDGNSACPGCGGDNFKEKHPSCGFLTCCVIKRNCEVCSQCDEYPCKRFDAEKEGYDSFVTHKKVFDNLNAIKSNGINAFIKEQEVRVQILKCFLSQYDDGRSKSFFCIACALLPLDKLQMAFNFAADLGEQLSLKEQNKQLKQLLTQQAETLGIILKLLHKTL